MPDSGDPPQGKKFKRAQKVEPDFTIDPQKPNATIELETADLLQLGQTGQLENAVSMTRELPRTETNVLVDLGPDPNAPPKEPNVFVELGASSPIPVQDRPPTPLPSAPRTVTSRHPPRPTPSRGMWLVVVVYVLSAAALGISIYLRWFDA